MRTENEALSQALDTASNSVLEGPKDDITHGSMCLYVGEKKPCRGTVLSILDDVVDVFLVDLGLSVTCLKEEIKEIPEDLKKFPPGTVIVHPDEKAEDVLK